MLIVRFVNKGTINPFHWKKYLIRSKKKPESQSIISCSKHDSRCPWKHRATCTVSSSVSSWNGFRSSRLPVLFHPLHWHVPPDKYLVSYPTSSLQRRWSWPTAVFTLRTAKDDNGIILTTIKDLVNNDINFLLEKLNC